MRQRIEDLGRLEVMLKEALDSDVFDYQYRFKDSEPPEGEVSGMHRIQIELLKEKLCDCLEIAQGQDWLNEADDGRR